MRETMTRDDGSRMVPRVLSAVYSHLKKEPGDDKKMTVYIRRRTHQIHIFSLPVKIEDIN